jgi:DNA-binding response OmpR family regulator
MNDLIVMASSDKRESRDLCVLLNSNGYRTIRSHSLANLETQVQENDCRVLVVDLDHLSVDNRLIRELSKHHPGLSIIAMSSRTFHPELEEALSSHISACLVKPVDVDELLFWVRSMGSR